MAFVRLSHHGTGRTIYVNPELVVTVEPELDGCIVRANNMNIKVEEKYEKVLELLQGLKRGEKKDGREESF
jgi:hypothetical protein